MKVLVTGGAGYIGSHTCVSLLDAGHEIVIVDNFSNSSPDVIDAIKKITGKGFPFYRLDVRDEKALAEVFYENKIDAVIHFAGYKAVGESVERPLMYYENNLMSTISLCKVMKQFSCKKIVFSSSATVYGLYNPIPYTEDMPLSAESPYGRTKLMIEQILVDICRSDRDFSAVLLRYFNPIGAHESGLIGENPAGIPNNLLPYVALVAVGKLPHLQVFGNDYDTRDGTGVRDYIHVCDLADGHLKALDYAAEHTGAEAINLGTGHGTSVLEIVDAFEKASGRTVNYIYTARRAGDIGEYYADTTKASEVLNWTAKYGIEKMCRDSWNFIKTKEKAGR